MSECDFGPAIKDSYFVEIERRQRRIDRAYSFRKRRKNVVQPLLSFFDRAARKVKP